MESTATDDLASLAASFPLLVYDHGEQPDNSHTLFSVADGSSRTCRVPELRSSRCACLETPCGLVLVADSTSSQCSLWNPQTGEKIALPALDRALPEYCRCLLSDTVSSPDCLVLINDVTQLELLFCHVRGGEEGSAWVSQPYDLGYYTVPESHSAPTRKEICNMAAVQGKFYYFMETVDEVGVLSLARDPEPRLEMSSFGATMPRFDGHAATLGATMSYLLESSQELFLVCLFFLGCNFERVEEVAAYKMDFSKKEWCKVTDIGDRAFLLGPHSFAASCSAGKHGLKRGCVYFAFDFFGVTNDIHIFDLREGTRELTGPDQDVPLPARQMFWMVPVCP